LSEITDIDFSLLNESYSPAPDVETASYVAEDEGDIDFSLLSTSYEANLDEIDTSRKLAYGAAQEPMIAGSLYRMAKAGANATFSESSFREEMRKVEAERQQEILSEFREFRGVSEDEEDLTILGGRIGTAIADPVTFFVPWAKIAKTGKIGGMAIAGTIGAGETAAREVSLYGEVDTTNVVIGAVTGGASQALGEVLSSVFRRADVEEALKDLEPTLSSSKEVSIVKDPIEGEFIPANISEPVSGSTIPRITGSIAEDVTPQIKVSEKETEDFVSAVAKVSGLEPKDISSTVFTKEIIQATRALDKDIAKVKQAIARTKDKGRLVEMNAQLKAFQKERTILLEETALKATKIIDAKADINIKAMEDLAENNNLTTALIQATMSEIGRPLMGGTFGLSTGLVMADEETEAEDLITWTAAGIAGGVALKKIMRSDKLTELDKETAAVSINKNVTKVWQDVLSSNSIPTLLAADGGWNKAIGRLMYSVVGSSTDSLESRMLKNQGDYTASLHQIYGDSLNDDGVATLVGEAMRGFINLDSVAVGYKGLAGNLSHRIDLVDSTTLNTALPDGLTMKSGITQAQIDEAKRILPQVSSLRDAVSKRMTDTGILHKIEDDYGLSQRYDLSKADTQDGLLSLRDDLEKALTLQNKNKGIKPPKQEEVDRIFDGIVGLRKLGSDADLSDNNSVFIKNAETGEYKFRDLAEFFEQERKLTDREAVKFLAEKGWINLNSKDVMYDYGFQSIKIADFAETFGANGELINHALKSTKAAFKDAIDGNKDDIKGRVFLTKQQRKQQQHLVDAVQVFWGGHGTRAKSDTFNTGIKVFTTLANTTYLTGVTLTNLADLTQPFLNSGFFASLKGATRRSKDYRFSKMTSFKHDQAFEQELNSLLKSGSKNSSSKVENFLHTTNDFFFRVIGLKKLNGIARNYAYDTGVNRIYELARKKKLSRTEILEVGALGLDVNKIKSIGQHDDIRVAFKEGNARDFMDIAGRKAADRDAIVPLMGNRLYFVQTNNEVVRSLGQFTSWSQAKSVQMNALADRVESADGKALIRLAATIPMAGAINWLKAGADSNYTEKEKEDDPALLEIGKMMKTSGNFDSFAPTKIMDGLRYAAQDGDAMAQVSPAIGKIQALAQEGANALVDFNRGDYEGALKEIADETPLLKQALLLYKNMTGDMLLEDEDNEKPKKYIPRLNKGGEVLDVPNVPTEPDQRIDKMTGRPYDQQAGTAFVDEEDPLRRLGFKGGGEVDPLRRLGFGGGGKVLNALRGERNNG
tara:strand:- start:1173 stop:4982 length:3810 start_codon:yes stop_codon:yes gene_type:complete